MDLKRPSPRRIAQGLLMALAVLIVAHAELRGQSQGDRITRIEHVHTVELCSTAVSCHRLLTHLLSSIGPKEQREIARHFAQRHTTPRASVKELAPQVAHSHRHATEPPRQHARPKRRHPVRLISPAPPIAIPATPAPSAPSPPPALPPPVPNVEHVPPGQLKKELLPGVPCPDLPAVKHLCNDVS